MNVSPAAADPAGAVTLTNLADVADRISPVAGATIDFRLYGPADTGYTGAPVFESPGVPYPAAGGAVTSAPYAPPTPGVYRWTASYSGDANNAPAVSGCSAATTVNSNAPPPCPTCAPRSSLAPVIGGQAARGRQLTCGAGVWTGVAPIAFAYRWLRDGTQVAVGQTLQGRRGGPPQEAGLRGHRDEHVRDRDRAKRIGHPDRAVGDRADQGRGHDRH